MTEESKNPAAEAGAPPSAEVVTVLADVPQAEKPLTQTEAPPAPVPEPEEAQKPATTDDVVEAEKQTKTAEEETAVPQSVSCNEESYVLAELPELQKKALEEFKNLVRDALNKHQFTAPPPPPPAPKEEEPKAEEKTDEQEPPKEEEKKKDEEEAKTEVKTVDQEPSKVETEKEKEKAVVVVTEVATVDDDGAKTVEAIEESVEVSIWGIPLLADDRSDVILLKFLRARDYKVKEAFTMLKNTVKWRKEYGIDDLIEEDLGSDWDKVVFSHGVDKEGHPVCYNVFGEFQNMELYQNTFSDEEKRTKFIKWRIQFLEKSIRKFDFNPTAISTIVQVNDLKNSPGFFLNKELVTGQAIQLLQDNYPEFVAKQVFINVPWWYLAFSRVISPFLTQRTKNKFVYAGPSKSADTLFKYIAPEQVPVQQGGLSQDGDQEFTSSDAVTEVTIKPSTKETVEIPVTETSVLVWELRVLGWNVSYGAEFVPSTEGHYTVIVQKARKVNSTEEAVISNSFKVGEPGKIVLTIDNQSSKKKKLLYRSKTKICS
uniref:Patellin-3 n=1 Tax=Cannabis sativa TaxID=3483 RepID=A0A803QKE9_CANSA